MKFIDNMNKHVKKLSILDIKLAQGGCNIFSFDYSKNNTTNNEYKYLDICRIIYIVCS
jgi:hypothetical protein